MPTKKRKQASKTPTPPGAVGTTNPKDHDNEKITNKNMLSRVLLLKKTLKKIKNPKN